jgi:hypothetical protein
MTSASSMAMFKVGEQVMDVDLFSGFAKNDENSAIDVDMK